MRIPPMSAISKASEDLLTRRFSGIEDQADWEVWDEDRLRSLAGE
jgi:hypothetical protein